MSSVLLHRAAWRLAQALVLFCAGALPAAAVLAQPPAAAVYAALSAISEARLSPNGRLLAGITSAKGRRAFAIWDLDGGAAPRVFPTGPGEPQWIVWKSPTRLLASLRVVSQRGPLRRTVDTRLIALDLRSGVVELVRGYNGDWEPQIQDHVLSLLPRDPDHVLLELPRIDRATRAQPSNEERNRRMEHPDAVLADLRDGSTRSTVPGHGLINHWVADRDGQIRLGWAYQRDRSVQLLRRASADSPWQSVLTLPLNAGQHFEPLSFVDGAPDRFYVQTNLEGDADAIVEYDLTTLRTVRVLADGKDGAVTPFVRDGLLVAINRADRNPVWLQADWAQDDALLAQALRGVSTFGLVDRSDDGQRALVCVRRGNEPRSYFLLSREDGKPVLEPVGDTQPGLPLDQIAPTREVSYAARDGLKIPALLTLPRGHKPADGTLPFVVLPHGGPTAHDSRGWDYWVQFLASRGYGVLQPQFRGSTGQGRAFQVAGFAQWGLAMQDDVTDGTRWLIEQKLADPARIALVGASYGGYAALMGVAKEPTLYRGAVAIAAVTDLQRLIDDRRDSLFGDLNLPEIGDRDQLRRTSPLRLVDRIAVPVLLVHGRQDFTVPVQHSEEMAAALKKAGRQVDALLLPAADHYFQAESDRLALLTALEQFLATHLK